MLLWTGPGGKGEASGEGNREKEKKEGEEKEEEGLLVGGFGGWSSKYTVEGKKKKGRRGGENREFVSDCGKNETVGAC